MVSLAGGRPAAAVADGAALSARNVIKRYGDAVALDGVSLTLAEGECVALVGESGSGKTTLLRCFNRMVVPDTGTVMVGGVDVESADPIALRRRIGYVQQEGGLLPHWTVLRNAGMVPWLNGVRDADDRVREALRRVGIEPEIYGSRWPRELSGGQRQRVAIARALAGDPSIVLLDEPFGALDAITRSETREVFGRLRSELTMTALLVTHDLHEAMQLADRIAVMRAGRIEQVAEPAALRAEPATEYVELLLEMAGAR